MSEDESTEDRYWETTVEIDGEPYQFSAEFSTGPTGPYKIAELIAKLNVPDDLSVGRAEHHWQYIALAAWVRAHVLRLAMGWESETRLALYLSDHPALVRRYEFKNPPKQPRLWELWEEEFSDSFQNALQTIAEELVELARDEGIAAPPAVFQPEDKTDVSKQTERDFIHEKTKKGWKHVKPTVNAESDFNRGANAEIPVAAFLEQQAHVGSKRQMCVESGYYDFKENTTRNEEKIPTGSNHRWQIRDRSVQEMRTQHRGVMETILREQNGQLPDRVRLAVDYTNGHPWHGKVKRDDDGALIDPFILGTEDGRPARKYSTIQIVNPELPLILDAVPVVRGMSRDAIVDTLLSNAMDLLNFVDVEIVVMDRAFDASAVKEACERHGVSYLNARRIFSGEDSEQEVINRLQAQGKLADITVDKVVDGDPKRVTVFLPNEEDQSKIPSDTSNEDNIEADAESATQMSGVMEDDLTDEFGFQVDRRDDAGVTSESNTKDVYEELTNEFEEVFGPLETDRDPRGREESEQGHPFKDVIRGTQEETPTTTDTASEATDSVAHEEIDYVAFESNHPYILERIDVDEAGNLDVEMTDRELYDLVSGLIQRYYPDRNWIESGYQNVKPFMVRTTSDCPRYRFFCFLFACLLYSVWKVVDVLVKLSLDEEPDLTGSPRVTQHLFCTIASKFYDVAPAD